MKCVCVDAKNKPLVIPESLWLKEGGEYVITHIYVMANQKGIQGCDVKGLDISAYIPFNCYRLDRFGFKKEDVPALVELLKNCSDLNNVDVEKLLEESLGVEI